VTYLEKFYKILKAFPAVRRAALYEYDGNYASDISIIDKQLPIRYLSYYIKLCFVDDCIDNTIVAYRNVNDIADTNNIKDADIIETIAKYLVNKYSYEVEKEIKKRLEKAQLIKYGKEIGFDFIFNKDLLTDDELIIKDIIE
jgi:hypothetical protein